MAVLPDTLAHNVSIGMRRLCVEYRLFLLSCDAEIRDGDLSHPGMCLYRRSFFHRAEFICACMQAPQCRAPTTASRCCCPTPASSTAAAVSVASAARAFSHQDLLKTLIFWALRVLSQDPARWPPIQLPPRRCQLRVPTLTDHSAQTVCCLRVGLVGWQTTGFGSSSAVARIYACAHALCTESTCE